MLSVLKCAPVMLLYVLCTCTQLTPLPCLSAADTHSNASAANYIFGLAMDILRLGFSLRVYEITKYMAILACFLLF